MKRIVVLVIVALCACMVYLFPQEMINPGDLVAGHQHLKDKCLACHHPFWGIASEKCISCHKLSDIGKDTLMSNDSTSNKSKTSFHLNFSNQECTGCHTDHKGLKPGISLSRFDHKFLSGAENAQCISCHSKPTDDVHAQLSTACNNCHNTQGWRSFVSFDHAMIQGADKNNCITCHQQPKATYHNQFNTDCAKCHITSKWRPSSFDHSSYFILDQNHNANCITCHSDNNFSAYTCYGCHEHSQGKMESKHYEEGITNIINCVRCHKSGNEHETEGGSRSNEGGEGHGKHEDHDDD
ncbi:MAG: hypothetical protein HY840_00560 [Bacteroidetes bacterium]|nr:hypothetical protein [Bacteroidota bacterium]